MISNLRIDLFVVWWEKWVVEKPVNPMDGLRVECVGNSRHDITKIIMVVIIYFIICGVVWSTTQTKRSQYDWEKHTGFPSHPLLVRITYFGLNKRGLLILSGGSSFYAQY